jgi:hypothetical protein
MMLLLGVGLLIGYIVLAIVVARFCAVNRGWEDALDQMPDDFPFVEIGAEGPKRRPAALEA